MLRTSSRTLAQAAALLCICAACGDSAAQKELAKKAICQVGTSYTCFRRNCTGHQECVDGTKFSPCVCNELQPAGRGASAGASASDAGAKDDKPKDATVPAKPNAPERCDNGDDDDGDGMIDCADPDCGNMRCVEVAPNGWQGPVAFRSASDPITCAGTFDQTAFEAGAEPDTAPASCATCSCKGGCSKFVDFGTSSAEQCAGTSCTTSVSASCVEISPQCLQNATTASLKTALPNNSTCTASQQHPSTPAKRWKTHATACRPTAAQRAGCNPEQLCLPKTPANTFEPSYCIWQDGEHDCPKAPYAQRRLYHRQLQDTRTCSPCTCTAPNCNYHWRVFNLDDTTCTNPILELSTIDQCAQINPVMGKLRVGTTTTGEAACNPAGGNSQGTVTAQDPVTICCSK